MGFTLAKYLEKKHDLVLIDINPKKCEIASNEIDGIVINGDCTKIKILEDAGIDNADYYIAVTGKDEVNLLSSLLAKSYGVKTIARISELEYKDVFERLGIDITISPEIIAAKYIEKLIERPGIIDLAIVGRGEAEILELKISKNSRAANKKIKDLGGGKDFLIISVFENGNLIIPSGETLLKPGDRILVLVKRGCEDKIKKLFLE